MLKDFAEYFYYLLTAPFKRVKKEANQWYILCRVMGEKYDEAKEALLRARDETMVATCSQAMLQEHGRDRGIARHDGEDLENYRKRIALYERICRLGGTNEGVELSVKALGYENVSIRRAKELYGDAGRWAEFVVILEMEADGRHPVAFGILKETVRKWKEAGAKDNYRIQYDATVQETHRCGASASYWRIIAYFSYPMLDGAWKLDGGVTLSGNRNRYPVRMDCRCAVRNAHICKAARHGKYDPFFLDGAWKLDGGKNLDAFEETEEL